MFSGIVTHVGRIAEVAPSGDGVRLRIAVPDLPLDEVRLGDSIAIQGICHTVVAKAPGAFEVDSSRATLDVTTGLAAGLAVNVERSLRLADRIDGHLVAGHIDGVGTVVEFRDVGGSAHLVVEAPAQLARYIARKGSIAVDGVSLTVNAVDGARFEVNVIPHTRAVTTLGRLAAGAQVNLEIDMLARYVERVLSASRDFSAK